MSEIVWEYSDPSLFEFFSPYISGAQRLANGNTLVCEVVPRMTSGSRLRRGESLSARGGQKTVVQ